MGGWGALFSIASEGCLLECQALDFCCPLNPSVSKHEYLHRPCLHPDQKRNNPAGEDLISEALTAPQMYGES